MRFVNCELRDERTVGEIDEYAKEQKDERSDLKIELFNIQQIQRMKIVQCHTEHTQIDH